MALLKWSKRYSVGVKEMDNQHINLLKRLNELHAAMLRGQARGIAGPLLLKMTEESREHFAAEEAMMEGAKFPGLAEHQAEHRALAAKVEEYDARFKQGDNDMYRELLFFVRDWFADHMQQVDKKYTGWMNEHGVR
ncbi:MAG: bacteriohemerythrin [Terracidiphilus sp.]|jgi:hemerythrin-like metal-binding protein